MFSFLVLEAAFRTLLLLGKHELHPRPQVVLNYFVGTEETSDNYVLGLRKKRN